MRQGVEKKGAIARAELAACPLSVNQLREQWQLQVDSQTSLRARE